MAGKTKAIEKKRGKRSTPADETATTRADPSGSGTAQSNRAADLAQFLELVKQRGQEPALQRTSGTVRFDVDRDGRTDHWRLAIHRGAVDVTRDAGTADCVVHGKAEVMDGLASGRSNALTALLRGELSLEGDRRLLVRVQRLFPDPIGRRATDSSRVVGRRRG